MMAFPRLRAGRAAASPPAGPAGGGGALIEILRDPDRLAALGPAWRALETQAGAGTFQSHDWISAWWHGGAARSGFRLHIALAWDGDELVGVLPLAVRRRHGLRVLEWAAKDVSDYCDALLAPSREDLILPLWRAARAQGGFDVAYLSHLRPGGVLVRFGQGRLRLWPGHRSTVASALRLGAWSSGAGFVEFLAPRERQNYRRRRRVLAQSGPVRFRVLRGAELWPAVERLRQMKLDWLRRTGLASPLFSDDGTMLRSLATALEARGCLRVFVLEAGDSIAAVTLSIAEGGRLLGFGSAYEQSLHRASPGTLAMIDEIAWAIDHGFTEVDFLCGDEAYKQRLASTCLHLGTLVHARTPLGLAALASDACILVMARLRARLGAFPGFSVAFSRVPRT
ncbi:GNAT family N-acetyltransferase [Teichococcus aestuarii]|uniref:GNAT family N-acetyltransferase n=1 Tax=Teichococcus aestuarii TaxID=568898 RepID=UPI00361B9C5C